MSFNRQNSSEIGDKSCPVRVRDTIKEPEIQDVPANTGRLATLDDIEI